MSTYETGPLFIKITAQGSNGAGAISVPGLQVGDHVNLVTFSGNLNVQNGSFEQIVSVADQLQQTAGADYSSLTLTAHLTRWA
ncbi:hypothetical protein [Burkholderia ubonensis]|uniref:hypothetical protein n=1 Tax=Burkholderia ubonensis TaxID=101571 RepID=UPI000A66A00A|nr:hypothetical protein [Burkholderia ubonensis]